MNFGDMGMDDSMLEGQLIVSRVLDGIFIGNRVSSQDVDFVETNKITHIINCCGRELRNIFSKRGNMRYLTLYWKDNERTVLFDTDMSVVGQITEFVDTSFHRGECVLIHSVHGVSRPCVVLMAYFMFKFQWSIERAESFIRLQHADMNIRPYFMVQLHALGRRLSRKRNIYRKTGKQSILKKEQEVLMNTFNNSVFNSKYKNFQYSDPSNIRKKRIRVRFSEEVTNCEYDQQDPSKNVKVTNRRKKNSYGGSDVVLKRSDSGQSLKYGPFSSYGKGILKKSLKLVESLSSTKIREKNSEKAAGKSVGFLSVGNSSEQNPNPNHDNDNDMEFFDISKSFENLKELERKDKKFLEDLERKERDDLKLLQELEKKDRKALKLAMIPTEEDELEINDIKRILKGEIGKTSETSQIPQNQEEKEFSSDVENINITNLVNTTDSNSNSDSGITTTTTTTNQVKDKIAKKYGKKLTLVTSRDSSEVGSENDKKQQRQINDTEIRSISLHDKIDSPSIIKTSKKSKKNNLRKRKKEKLFRPVSAPSSSKSTNPRTNSKYANRFGEDRGDEQFLTSGIVTTKNLNYSVNLNLNINHAPVTNSNYIVLRNELQRSKKKMISKRKKMKNKRPSSKKKRKRPNSSHFSQRSHEQYSYADPFQSLPKTKSKPMMMIRAFSPDENKNNGRDREGQRNNDGRNVVFGMGVESPTGTRNPSYYLRDKSEREVETSASKKKKNSKTNGKLMRIKSIDPPVRVSNSFRKNAKKIIQPQSHFIVISPQTFHPTRLINQKRKKKKNLIGKNRASDPSFYDYRNLRHGSPERKIKKKTYTWKRNRNHSNILYQRRNQNQTILGTSSSSRPYSAPTSEDRGKRKPSKRSTVSTKRVSGRPKSAGGDILKRKFLVSSQGRPRSGFFGRSYFL